MFANAKRWSLGVYHGLRQRHLQAYLDEFVFRFNRRRTPAAAFERLLGLAATLQPASYQMLISGVTNLLRSYLMLPAAFSL